MPHDPRKSCDPFGMTARRMALGGTLLTFKFSAPQVCQAILLRPAPDSLANNPDSRDVDRIADLVRAQPKPLLHPGMAAQDVGNPSGSDAHLTVGSIVELSFRTP